MDKKNQLIINNNDLKKELEDVKGHYTYLHDQY